MFKPSSKKYYYMSRSILLPLLHTHNADAHYSGASVRDATAICVSGNCCISRKMLVISLNGLISMPRLYQVSVARSKQAMHPSGNRKYIKICAREFITKGRNVASLHRERERALHNATEM